MAQNFSYLGRLVSLVRRPSFWFIFVLIVLITIPQYQENLPYPDFIIGVIASLDLHRHAFERILYLAPVVWAGFLFGWKGSFITSLFAVACMLPRAIFFATSSRDAIFETGAVFVIGNVLAISFASLRKEREHRIRLEIAQRELISSEARYRELFENALDAIWIHDLDGNIITANKATEKLSGYTVEELTKKNVRDFMAEDSFKPADMIRKKLLANEPAEQPYEQHMLKKDGQEAFIQLATSLLLNKGEPVAFQHIARDITEQKHMQENLNFYLQQATRAQEEERKRISRELHDETIQSLVVLSRQLDLFESSCKTLSAEESQLLEKLIQQTGNIMREVRRLSQDLRPAALDRLGLSAALEWLAADVSEYSRIATKVNVLGSARRLTEEVELVLFRITQEALRNVWRHSQASKAEITVEFADSMVRITVSDNGKGFSLPPTIGDLTRSGKLGLTGMQERARLVGASLKVHSQPGQGTSVTVELPT